MKAFRHKRICLLVPLACSLMLANAAAKPAPAQELTNENSSIEVDETSVPTDSTFQRCILTARQVSPDRMQGSIELLPDQNSRSDESFKSRLTIGRTNLEQLRLSSDGRRIEVGADASGNLIPLSDSPLATVNGTWERTGTTIGETTSWRFLLPSVAVCEINLETAIGISVSSPDALVIPVPTLSGKAKWRLLPRNPQDVTIRCRGASSDASESETLSLSGDISLSANSLSGTWVVTTSKFRDRKSLGLHFSAPCDIVRVSQPDKSRVDWKFNRATNDLQVQLPSNGPTKTSLESLKIEIDRQDDDGAGREIPIPVPIQAGQHAAVDVRRQLRFRLQSSTIKSSNCLNTACRWPTSCRAFTNATSPGHQTVCRRWNLCSSKTPVSAKLFTTPSNAILDDSTFTLFNPDSSPDEAVVFLEVSAMAGSTGSLEYRIPAEWQVKDVADAVSGHLLLFRMFDDGRGRRQRRFTTWLRSPLVPDSVQRLRLRLLSTESTSGRRFASPNYRFSQSPSGIVRHNRPCRSIGIRILPGRRGNNGPRLASHRHV